jgi:CDP-diacylglycerol pyrophosphatase
VGTEDELLSTLNSTSLESWKNRRDAIPQRVQKALVDAAKLLEPKVVHLTLPSATIRGQDELEAWIGEVKAQVEAALKNGPVAL